MGSIFIILAQIVARCYTYYWKYWILKPNKESLEWFICFEPNKINGHFYFSCVETLFYPRIDRYCFVQYTTSFA